jgi:hypothetical protein
MESSFLGSKEATESLPVWSSLWKIYWRQWARSVHGIGANQNV